MFKRQQVRWYQEGIEKYREDFKITKKASREHPEDTPRRHDRKTGERSASGLDPGGRREGHPGQRSHPIRREHNTAAPVSNRRPQGYGRLL